MAIASSARQMQDAFCRMPWHGASLMPGVLEELGCHCLNMVVKVVIMAAGRGQRQADGGRCCAVHHPHATAVCAPQLFWDLLQDHPKIHVSHTHPLFCFLMP